MRQAIAIDVGRLCNSGKGWSARHRGHLCTLLRALSRSRIQPIGQVVHRLRARGSETDGHATRSASATPISRRQNSDSLSAFACCRMSLIGPERRLLRDSNTSEIGAKRKWLARAQNVTNDPGCVKTLGGTTALGILGSTVMRRAKKRKNLSSARHYDQIRFRFHTTKTHQRHRAGTQPAGRGVLNKAHKCSVRSLVVRQ